MERSEKRAERMEAGSDWEQVACSPFIPIEIRTRRRRCRLSEAESSGHERGSLRSKTLTRQSSPFFSAVDAPIAPSDKGLGRFLNGVTDEMKQTYRERLFAVTDKNLIDVAGRYLAIGQQTHGVTILGPENESIRKDPSWVVK